MSWRNQKPAYLLPLDFEHKLFNYFNKMTVQTIFEVNLQLRFPKSSDDEYLCLSDFFPLLQIVLMYLNSISP